MKNCSINTIVKKKHQLNFSLQQQNSIRKKEEDEKNTRKSYAIVWHFTGVNPTLLTEFQ